MAAYCRVSSSSEDQLNSFAAQNIHYTQYITEHENWRLVDIYADEGITGTSVEKREDFKRMLADSGRGLIDRILVKSISRFARNTAECLEAIRQFRANGTTIFFEKENIDTARMSSELMTALVKIFGLDADAYEQEIKDRIGIVMDSNYFYNDLSMKDMKSIVAPAYSKWSDADYRAYMEKFELDPKQKISTLSRGMRMKYALVLALSHQAELLIMDEPTSGLDPLVRSQFLEIVLDYMKNGGKGVFFSTHITSDLDKIADMLILIDGGKIIFQRDKDDLLDTFRTVKGNTAALNDKNKRLIRGLRVSAFGFTGITDQVPEIKKEMPDVLLEKATIEDIMLAYIGGENDDL